MDDKEADSLWDEGLAECIDSETPDVVNPGCAGLLAALASLTKPEACSLLFSFSVPDGMRFSPSSRMFLTVAEGEGVWVTNRTVVL